jgi:hypothetical protein
MASPAAGARPHTATGGASRTPRPRATTTRGATEGAELPAEAPRLDRRRTHVVDRAADYAELAARGMSVAQIARRRRRSKSYVSIVLRLGQALAGMEPGERAAMRSPFITWTLAQRVVRRDTDAVSLRAQLRYALGGFSTHNIDGRKQRRGRTAAAPRTVGVAWGWDADWFARDPGGYAAAHLEHLASVTTAVSGRARRAGQAGADARLDSGQSLRLLQRRIAARRTESPTALSPDAQRALAAFAVLERKLAEAAAEIAALPAAGTPGAAGARPAPQPAPRPSARPPEGEDATELALALEADLHDD